MQICTVYMKFPLTCSPYYAVLNSVYNWECGLTNAEMSFKFWFIVQNQKHCKFGENEGNLARKVRFWTAPSLHDRFVTKIWTIFAASCTPEPQNCAKNLNSETPAQQCKMFQNQCFYNKINFIFETSFIAILWFSIVFVLKNRNSAY